MIDIIDYKNKSVIKIIVLRVSFDYSIFHVLLHAHLSDWRYTLGMGAQSYPERGQWPL